MNKLKNKIIVYDDSCPMCKAYTGAFVKWGIIKPENRQPFSSAIDKVACSINLKKARHHIPLIDGNTGRVMYGLQSLFYILAARFPRLGFIFKSKLLVQFWQPIYNFISYNRRVIAGSSKPKSGFDCAPDFSFKFRLSYIVLASGFTIFFSFLIADHLSSMINFSAAAIFAALSSGWVLFALSYIERTAKERINFFGHLITVSLIGSAMMLPALLFNSILPIGLLALLCLSIMLKQMNKRTEAINLSNWHVSLWFFFLTAGALFIFLLHN